MENIRNAINNFAEAAAIHAATVDRVVAGIREIIDDKESVRRMAELRDGIQALREKLDSFPGKLEEEVNR